MYAILVSGVGIKGPWFMNHKSISWTHKPKIYKISIYHELFSAYLSRVKVSEVEQWKKKIQQNGLACF